MKKPVYIVAFVIFVGLCIGIYGVFYFFYIPRHAESTFEQKRESLEMDIKKQIKEAWGSDNALLFFKDYGGAKYLRMDMDAVRFIDKRYNHIEVWGLFPNGRYGNSVRLAIESAPYGIFSDLYDLYYIQYMPWRGTYIEPDQNLYNIKVFNYSPVFVGYKTENISLRNYRPSFDECCIDAKKYMQQEDKDNRMYYKPQNEERVNKILNLRNDYYYFEYCSFLESSTLHSNIERFNFAEFNFFNHDIPYYLNNFDLKCFYNGYYKVFIFIQRSGTWYLSFNDTKYNQELESYIVGKRKICNVVVIIFAIILVISLAIIHKKSKKASNNNRLIEKPFNSELLIFEKVINLSNPERFIKPYQPEKLEKANRIYSNALKNKDNTDVLEKLFEEAKAL